IDHAHCTLLHQGCRFCKYGGEIFLTAATHQHRTARRLYDTMEILCICCRVCLDDVSSHFTGEPRKRHDLVGVTIDHVAAALCDWLHDERFDHQRHTVFFAICPDAGNVLHALTKEVWLVRQHEEVHHHAGRIHLQRSD